MPARVSKDEEVQCKQVLADEYQRTEHKKEIEREHERHKEPWTSRMLRGRSAVSVACITSSRRWSSCPALPGSCVGGTAGASSSGSLPVSKVCRVTPRP